MVEVEAGVRMVAAQLLLMNHFLMSLSYNSADISSFHDINSVSLDAGECSYGCTQCSPINGCLACKPPFFLSLQRDGIRQTAICTRSCPKGFYKLKKKRNGFCTKCTMRGCIECLDSRYCSTCDKAYVNFFGKCIKQKSDEGREEIGLYTTTRYPEFILATSDGGGSSTNATSLSSKLPVAVNSSAATGSTTSTPGPPPSTAVTFRTKDDGHRQSNARFGDTTPDFATRFYFTTPTSPIISENSASGISPYPSETPVQEEVQCRRRGGGRTGRPRGERKDRKGRRNRKKKGRGRKYRRRGRRRRKGRRGQKNRRKGCQERERTKKRSGGKSWRVSREGNESTPPSQDPAIRVLNSAEPRLELSANEFQSRRTVPFVTVSNEASSSESTKVSLLEDTEANSGFGRGSWSKDMPLHFQNRPRAMAAFKRSLANRKTERNPFQTKSRHNRVRHGKSRHLLPVDQGTGGPSSIWRRPRTKSWRRRRRQQRQQKG